MAQRPRLPLAREALAAFGFAGAQARLHSNETNALYRIRLRADGGPWRRPAGSCGGGAERELVPGERLMLRLATPGWRTRADLENEALWLEALERDGCVAAPRVVRAPDGRAVVPIGPEAPDTGSPAPSDASGDARWHATLMTWLPGRLLGRYLTPANLTRMGELFATLHAHGAEWAPPEGFTTRVFDRFLGRGEPDVILDHAELVGVPGGTVALLERLIRRVNDEYASLDRGDVRVIHCDLWHDNIKLHRGRLLPFDFEDTVHGFRLHDIAMALLDLLEEVGDARYHELLPAFRTGYERSLSWPAGDLAALQVGRILWKINSVARFGREWLPRMLTTLEPTLRRFDERGELRLGNPT